MCFVVTCWERADLLALVCGVCCEFVTTFGILGQVWYLIVSIPDLCTTSFPTFIENFLADRTMQVRVGSSMSDFYDQEQAVPQGGVLSTTLFSIKINDIVKCLGNLTDCSLYVNDFCICYRSKSMGTIERQLQHN